MATEVLESGEILRDDNVDKSLKQDLENLAKNINVKEVSSDKVDALFSKLDSVDAEAKNRALQYALKNSKIMVGNTEKSVVEIAEAFDKAVEQDWSTWKIKVKEGVAQEDKDLVEWFLNEKWSSLAYLIQLSSQKASLQASRWYWKSNADKIIDVGADKVFWNQTRRALSWLREWIEWDYTKNVEAMDVKSFKVEDVLKLKFISNALKTRIETEAKDENVKWLWSNGNYELKSKYTNNFALKEKVITVDDPKREENKQYVESNVGDKKVKVYTVTSLEELPAWYKWKDPENYDEKNKDTYPKVYNLSVDGVKYSFYSNWRCHNGSDNKMYNTRDIVDRLRILSWNKEEEDNRTVDTTSWNEVESPENLEKFNSKVFEVLNKEFKGVLNELNLSEYNMTYSGWGKNPKVWISLKTKEKYWWVQQTKWVWVNLHNFVGEDWMLDKDKLKLTIKNMNDDYEKQVKLENQEKEDSEKFLVDIRNTTYSFSDLFWNVAENVYYKAFFNEFSNWMLKIRSTTAFQWDKLKIELDKGWPNLPSWLRWHEIDKNSLKWRDWKYSMEFFKKEMKKIVDKIVKENFS